MKKKKFAGSKSYKENVWQGSKNILAEKKKQKLFFYPHIHTRSNGQSLMNYIKFAPFIFKVFFNQYITLLQFSETIIIKNLNLSVASALSSDKSLRSLGSLPEETKITGMTIAGIKTSFHE